MSRLSVVRSNVRYAQNLLNMIMQVIVLPLMFAALVVGNVAAENLPQDIQSQLPANYRVMTFAKAQPRAGYDAVFVVLAATSEARFQSNLASAAPYRPALLFERRAQGRYRLVARNDHIALRINEGGQCDPFEYGAITVRGIYVTFENNVACGQHWTFYVTFSFNPRTMAYQFHNTRYQSLSWNPDRGPNANALIEDPVRLVRAGRTPVGFGMWRPTRD
jgi:hypothetical protein